MYNFDGCLTKLRIICLKDDNNYKEGLLKGNNVLWKKKI
jgi:hypothetical protein